MGTVEVEVFVRARLIPAVQFDGETVRRNSIIFDYFVYVRQTAPCVDIVRFNLSSEYTLANKNTYL